MARLFHTPRPNEFDVKPRFWDKEKEEREVRFHRAHVGEDRDHEGDEYISSISKGSFRSNPIEAKWSVSKVKRTSNRRLLALIVLLALALFFLLT